MNQNPPIMLFDEATSALDQSTETAIMNTIRDFLHEPHPATEIAGLGSRTAIFIAHRLRTIMDCNHIVVMKEGRVAEFGTHDELLARGGMYAAMWKAQQEGSNSEAEAEEAERVKEEDEIRGHKHADEVPQKPIGTENPVMLPGVPPSP